MGGDEGGSRLGQLFSLGAQSPDLLALSFVLAQHLLLPEPRQAPNDDGAFLCLNLERLDSRRARPLRRARERVSAPEVFNQVRLLLRLR